MSSFVTVPLYIQYGEISQYLSQHDMSRQAIFRGGAINKNYTKLLSVVTGAVNYAYNKNPNDVTLNATATYLYQLCGGYANKSQSILNNLAGTLPIITGPANQSGLVGFNASFSVSVAGTGPFTYLWFKNGVALPSQTTNTLSVPNAQLSDSGNQFFVQVTNASGTQTSGTATLTVTASLVGRWYAGGTDYSTQLLSGVDAVAYSGTFSITDGQPFNVPLPIGQSDFVVIQYPISQALRIHYANPIAGIDQAAIPGLAFDQNTFGGNNYTFSRNGNQFGINNVTGIVQFS